jgi:HK97 family phage prohead protease
MAEAIIERAFAVDDIERKGRVVTLRAVPYGVPTVVRDRLPVAGMPHGPYRESWERGAFRKAVNAPNRVKLIVGSHEHRARRDPQADVGHGLALLERDDALYGDFQVTASPFGDHALAKLDDGEWRGVSIGARAQRHRNDNGVVVHTLAALDHVLLTEFAQHPGAEVLAVRDDPDSFMGKWWSKYMAVKA